MGEYSEIDALQDVHNVMEKLQEQEARTRVLQWAINKYGDKHVAMGASASISEGSDSSGGKTKTRKNKSSRSRKAPKKSSANPSLVKNLNLRPSGKKALKDFVAEKAPTNQLQRCVVAVYYLKNILGLPAVGMNHVYTCFKDQGWRVPADLRNTLQSAASHRGWLDTANIDDIKLVPAGENLVEHDLPRSTND